MARSGAGIRWCARCKAVGIPRRPLVGYDYCAECLAHIRAAAAAPAHRAAAPPTTHAVHLAGPALVTCPQCRRTVPAGHHCDECGLIFATALPARPVGEPLPQVLEVDLLPAESPHPAQGAVPTAGQARGMAPSCPGAPTDGAHQPGLDQEADPEAVVGTMYGVCGLVCAAVALTYFPPLFGALAVGFGAGAISKRRFAIGIVCVVAGIACAIAGSEMGAASWRRFVGV